MIQCQGLFPLAVLMTSCFISCLLADTLSASRANSEGGERNKQQRELPQQTSPPFQDTLPNSVLSEDLLKQVKVMPTIADKRDSGWMDRLSRGLPRFAGMKRANEEVKRVEKRVNPYFIDERTSDLDDLEEKNSVFGEREYHLPPTAPPRETGK